MTEWMQRHPQAATELLQMLNIHPLSPLPDASEAAVQVNVRLAASKSGWPLWRNNVGAYLNDKGTMIRYGLCNDSKQLNASHKSSDLIGLRPVLITQEMVGKVIGQFVALEVKHGDWAYKATDREKAQLKFLALVRTMGGHSKFITSELDIW